MSKLHGQRPPLIEHTEADSGTAFDAHTVPFVQSAGDSKSLHFSFSAVQSHMDLHRPERLTLAYTRTMMGFLLFKAQPSTVAMIGLGGGSLARFILHHLPQTALQVVEINPNVVDLRHEFLLPDDGERFQVHLGNGADFVHTRPRDFDVLLVDGFDVQGQPPELATPHFYSGCAECLTPRGLLVANLSPTHPGFAQQLQDIGQVFGGQVLAVHDEAGSNSVVFASQTPLREQFMRHGWRCRWRLPPKAYADLLPELRTVAEALHRRANHRP